MMMFRSILFVIWMYGLMAVLGLLALPALLLPKSVTFWAISLYARGLIWGLKRCFMRASTIACWTCSFLSS